MKKYLESIILHVVKLLYGLAEDGNRWFATYLDHHKEKLSMEMSPYDACLFITKNEGENFNIIEL